MTKTVWLEFLNDDSKAGAIAVIKRMGWNISRQGRKSIRVFGYEGQRPSFFSSKCTMPSSTARWRTQRAEFSLYTTASKKSIGKLHKKSCFGSPEIVQLFSKKFLTSGACGGILFTEVKRGTPKGFQKDFEKTS